MIEMAHRPHERFLSDVLGILPVAKLAQADRKDQPLELLDKDPYTVSVASQAAFDEFTVIHRAVHLSGK